MRGIGRGHVDYLPVVDLVARLRRDETVIDVRQRGACARDLGRHIPAYLCERTRWIEVWWPRGEIMRCATASAAPPLTPRDHRRSCPGSGRISDSCPASGRIPDSRLPCLTIASPAAKTSATSRPQSSGSLPTDLQRAGLGRAGLLPADLQRACSLGVQRNTAVRISANPRFSTTPMHDRVSREHMPCASMTIRSPSRANDVSDLIRHLNAWSASGTPTRVRQDRGWLQLTDGREHLPHRAIVADYATRTDRTVERLLDVQQAHPLVGVPLADRCPTRRLTARWRDLLGDAHWLILDQCPHASSFLAFNDVRRRRGVAARKTRGGSRSCGRRSRAARSGQAPALQPGRDGGGDAPGVDGCHAAGPYRADRSAAR
jgi:hypothetical protein